MATGEEEQKPGTQTGGVRSNTEFQPFSRSLSTAIGADLYFRRAHGGVARADGVVSYEDSPSGVDCGSGLACPLGVLGGMCGVCFLVDLLYIWNSCMAVIFSGSVWVNDIH